MEIFIDLMGLCGNVRIYGDFSWDFMVILHEIQWECSRLQLVDDEFRAEIILSRSIQYLRDLSQSNW